MFASVRALLSGIIDYAGMFPPAKLPLEEAIRNYARYRTEPESWMLGRFICPAARLEELAHYVPHVCRPPLKISVLGKGGATAAEFISGFRSDLEIIGGFRKEFGPLVEPDVYEARFPVEVLRPDQREPEQLAALPALEAAVRSIIYDAYPSLRLFYELPFDETWRQSIADLTSVLWTNTDISPEEMRGRMQGIKIRCGGQSASDYPSSEQVAVTIGYCCRQGTVLKATAGLHHPFRHFDAAAKTKMHGFINIFAAAALAISGRLTEPELQSIIDDQNCANFVFDDDQLRWRSCTITTAGIERARRVLIQSFGSCSFDEPRDNLRALGLLT